MEVISYNLIMKFVKKSFSISYAIKEELDRKKLINLPAFYLTLIIP
ncbi:MAG: hypothetical protein OSJ63_02005 [Bacilli bacterium]|nr:hypothetical protein [Bacilli bacterium]